MIRHKGCTWNGSTIIPVIDSCCIKSIFMRKNCFVWL